jgi:cephalosporin-C deacetylase-like acetyl esterase
MRLHRQSLGVLIALAAAAARLSAQGTPANQADLDRLIGGTVSGPPLVVKQIGTQREGDVTIDDVTFPSISGGAPIEAYIVRPTAPATGLAGVLFVHWFGPPAPTSNRTQFLDEARALARRGTVSLLVSTFWSDPKRYQARRWETDFDNSVAQAKDLRRALDVLTMQRGVDPERIAYVGHDYGAMFGMLISAVDPRPKAYALIAPAPRFTDWYLFGSASGVPTGDARAQFLSRFATIEPVNVIGRTKARVFFQFGEMDRYTPRKDFIELYLAGPASKRMATYPSEHEMTDDIIRRDRMEWLSDQLGLGRTMKGL